MKEVKAIREGKISPAEVIEIEPNPKLIRKKLKLTQLEFASFVGVNEYTLKNWEQGRRRIPSTAKTLFRIANVHPEIVFEMTGKRKLTAVK